MVRFKKNNVQGFIGVSLNKNSPKCIFPCLYKEIISFLMGEEAFKLVSSALVLVPTTLSSPGSLLATQILGP